MDRPQGRIQYANLVPVAFAVVCCVVSFFVPTSIGNWLVVIGIAVALVSIWRAVRGSGDRSFPGRH